MGWRPGAGGTGEQPVHGAGAAERQSGDDLDTAGLPLLHKRQAAVAS